MFMSERYSQPSASSQRCSSRMQSSGEPATARPGPAASPALVVKLSVADFARLAAGELDPGRALLSGQLDLEGDFAVATRLGAMFGRPD